MGKSFLQLSPEEEIEVRSCLAAIEIEERKREIEKKEKELQEKERLKQKAMESQAGGRPTAANGTAARPLG